MTPAKKPRIDPLKVVFALGYVMQGLATPFQGITYQSFIDHLHLHYGLSDGATQRLFGKSYLAWSIKPIIGFLIDAYGRTRAALIALLVLAALGYLLMPLFDTGPTIFFGLLFGLSVVFAGTDVAIDRATVIAGDEEAKTTGRPRATTVGLNQAICWLAVYGTGIVALKAGGRVAEHVPLKGLLASLAVVPVFVLLFVLRLPKDRAVAIPLTRSLANFWSGLNSGSILGVMLFFFLFHCQPRFDAILNGYMIETLRFSRPQIGSALAAGYAGYFAGVLLFMWKGVRWQERIGLRKLFRIYIAVGAIVGLTQFLLLDPAFSRAAGGLSHVLPFIDQGTVRLVLLCAIMALVAAGDQLIRTSTLSVVGAIVPVAAAGSLFAGFMSVINLGYTFGQSSGAWLYDSGMSVAALRAVQQALFGISGGAADKLSLQMVILLASLAYFPSFLAVHLLPDRDATRATGAAQPPAGPERWLALSAGLRRATNWTAIMGGTALLVGLIWGLKVDPIASALTTFLGVCLVRQLFLDAALRRLSRS